LETLTRRLSRCLVPPPPVSLSLVFSPQTNTIVADAFIERAIAPVTVQWCRIAMICAKPTRPRIVAVAFSHISRGQSKRFATNFYNYLAAGK